jgi:septation ring formation regulator EzrA
MDALRARLEGEHKKAIASWQRQLRSAEHATEKLRNQLQEKESTISEARKLVELKKRQMLRREEAHLVALEDLQKVVDDGTRAQEKLKQEKTVLRHRIVRLRTRLKGEGAETIPNLVRCCGLVVVFYYCLSLSGASFVQRAANCCR